MSMTRDSPCVLCMSKMHNSPGYVVLRILDILELNKLYDLKKQPIYKQGKNPFFIDKFP
jgi:hypothetical protein